MNVWYLLGLALACPSMTRARADVAFNTSNISALPPKAATASIPTATTRGNSTFDNSSQATGTCCYISARYVGVNTWYSKPIKITMTVITTWLQYNNTIIPANSTTLPVQNATSLFGSYSFGASITSVPTTVPTDLLPVGAGLYGSTIIGNIAVTFVEQGNLVIQSPTPFFQFPELDIDTSWVCPTPTVITSYADTIVTVDHGTFYQLSTTVVPRYTTSEFPDPGYPLDYPQRNAMLGGIVQPFPEGDYSNFSYADWINNSGVGWSQGPDHLHLSDLPMFLAKVPAASSSIPYIGSCTILGGDGQPTVHVAVTQVTETVHSTLKIPGAIDTSRSTPSIEAAKAPTALPLSIINVPTSTERFYQMASTISTPSSGLDSNNEQTSSKSDIAALPSVVRSPPSKIGQDLPTKASIESPSLDVGRIIASVIGGGLLEPDTSATSLTRDTSGSFGSDAHYPDSQSTSPGAGDTLPSSTTLFSTSLLISDSAYGNSHQPQTAHSPEGITRSQNSYTALVVSDFTGFQGPTSGQRLVTLSFAGTPVVTYIVATSAVLFSPENAGQVTKSGNVITKVVSSEYVIGSKTMTMATVLTTEGVPQESVSPSSNAILTTTGVFIVSNIASGGSPACSSWLQILVIGGWGFYLFTCRRT